MKNRKKTRAKSLYSAKTVAAHKRRLRRLRPVHKKFLLHPITVFFWICVGVALTMLTFKAGADTLLVTARNPGYPPAQAAVITSPKNGQHFTVTPITVSGTCPADSYIKLYRNNVFSGVAICQANKTFSLRTDLFPGANELIAHVFNLADAEGPVSVPVVVYYDIQASAGIAPFLVSSEFLYKGFYAGQDFNWQIQVKGGTPPYAVTIKWGDGQETTIARKDDSSFLITHKYSRPGSYKGNYIIEINASDAAGHSAFLQLMAVINRHGTLTAAGTITSTPTNLRQWLWIIWPLYLILLLMTFSFWLGERQELYKILRSRSRPKRA